MANVRCRTRAVSPRAPSPYFLGGAGAGAFEASPGGSIPSSSTSNTRVAPGLILGGKPRSP